MRIGRRVGGATVVAALVGLCALAGCSGSHDAADSEKTCGCREPRSPSSGGYAVLVDEAAQKIGFS
jgi:hypothetical protein